MRKLLLIALLLMPLNASAYTIGGAWATLINCQWGQWGFEWGNIGTYDVNGQRYQVFFGSNWCQQ